jgi:chemotaxis signal transduction protein
MVTAAVARHMSSVEDYRERLAALQGAWDTLSLLSHLSADGADVTATRQAFETLATDLIVNLREETSRKALLGLKAKAQIAIDVMIRNLYERTADIGFLATDHEIREYLSHHAAGERDARRDAQLVKRLAEYVAKYSVYHDVILLDAQGRVALRLDASASVERTTHDFFNATLTTRAGYVETFDRIDLLPDHERSLVYSFRVSDGGKTLGVLCLCFRFEDEVRGIFAKLRDAADWLAFCFVDAAGHIIASSDRWHLPIGAPMPLALDERGGIVRFAGREYLAITRRTQGYQGYVGPGWCGHALLPIEHAFDRETETAGAQIEDGVVAALRDSETIFSEALRRIPRQADAIQRELNRTVWNGNVRLAASHSYDFAKTLLWEIGNAGRRTQDTFERSIHDLRVTVVSAILEDAELLATLAIDVLDRNLYERANDCRWWAMTATLIAHLRGAPIHTDEVNLEVSAVLRHLNSLYTVYHDIVLFDRTVRIVSVSNHANDRFVGEALDAPWVTSTLALRDSQHIATSAFGPSALYGEAHALIFGAALREASGTCVGGIGLIFDTTRELTAMLRDALPRTESGDITSGCVGAFVDTDGRVLAATSGYAPGDMIALPRELLTQTSGAATAIVTLEGQCYATGICRARGYREYRGMGAIGVVMVPLGAAATERTSTLARRAVTQRRSNLREQVIDIATFHCGHQWLGLARAHVIEALDSTHIRAVPGSPLWHAGLILYRERPLPVIDLPRLLHGQMTSTGGTASRSVIIARVGDEPSIALLVDALAEIPEVAVSRILPVAELALRGGPAILDRAVRPEQPDDPMLFVMNLEQLVAYTRAVPMPTDSHATRALRAVG